MKKISVQCSYPLRDYYFESYELEKTRLARDLLEHLIESAKQEHPFLRFAKGLSSFIYHHKVHFSYVETLDEWLIFDEKYKVWKTVPCEWAAIQSSLRTVRLGVENLISIEQDGKYWDEPQQEQQ